MHAPQTNEFNVGLARWLGSVLSGGPNSLSVAKLIEMIDDIARAREDFTLKIGAKRTATSTAYYAFSCSAGVFALPMTTSRPWRLASWPTACS